jgi:ATP-binding cassette subfamily F protein 3
MQGVAQAAASNGHLPVQATIPDSGDAKKRLNPIKRKQMEERSRDIEEEIARVEAAIAISESALLNYVSAEETKRVNLDLERQRQELAQLMTEWEELGQALEAG